MKAYVLNGINQLKYEEVEKPLLTEGWALVKVGAAGICESDIPRIYPAGRVQPHAARTVSAGDGRQQRHAL